jgi:hypothetical protein
MISLLMLLPLLGHRDMAHRVLQLVYSVRMEADRCGVRGLWATILGKLAMPDPGMRLTEASEKGKMRRLRQRSVLDSAFPPTHCLIRDHMLSTRIFC